MSGMYKFNMKEIPIDFSKYRFDYDEKIEAEKYSLYHKDIGVAGPGDIVFLAGREKSRKSTLLDCFLYGNYLRDPRKTLFFNADIGKQHILHIDTEHSKQQFSKLRKNFCNGTTYKSNIPTYHPYLLRKFDWKERIKFLKDVIDYMDSCGQDIGILAIDQVGDFVANVNDDFSVGVFVDYILELAEEKELVVMPVLHTNRGGEETLGKLGAKLDKKCTSQFIVSYDKDTKLSKVENVRARNRPIDDDLFFKHDELGYPFLVTDEIF